MAKYKIEITETLQRIVEVEARSAREAEEIVCCQYAGEKIVLDASDYKEVKIVEYKE